MMIDLTFLKSFTKGNSEKMKRYIGMYLREAGPAFDRMRINIDEKDWHTLAVNAHSLKPQAEYMGLIELKELLMKIEHQGKAGAGTDLETLYEKARLMNEQASLELKDAADRL